MLCTSSHYGGELKASEEVWGEKEEKLVEKFWNRAPGEEKKTIVGGGGSRRVERKELEEEVDCGEYEDTNATSEIV